MEIKPADLVLVRGTGPVADIIKRVTNSPYSHVAMLVKPNELIEAQGFRNTGYQGLDFYQGCSDIYTLDMLTEDQRARIVAHMMQEVGGKYDYKLLAWEFGHYVFHLDLPFHEDTGHHDCMTAVAEAYRVVVDPWPGRPYPVPGNIEQFRKIGSI
jgi:hypothetical protein